jgi:hypothetical protein
LGVAIGIELPVAQQSSERMHETDVSTSNDCIPPGSGAGVGRQPRPSKCTMAVVVVPGGRDALYREPTAQQSVELAQLTAFTSVRESPRLACSGKSCQLPCVSSRKSGEGAAGLLYSSPTAQHAPGPLHASP